MGSTPYQNLVRATPFRGGAVTAVEKALLPSGAFSMVQNLRPRRPGFIKRPGQVRLHANSYGGHRVLSLYQFRQTETDAKYLFAQMNDGNILQASYDPPTIGDSGFGSSVYAGSTGQRPGSWAVVNDILVHSNGVDQHLLYSGSQNYVHGFFVFKDDNSEPDYASRWGEDWSQQAHGSHPDDVELDALENYANYQCFFIRTPIRASAFTFTVSTGNSNAATLSCYYRQGTDTANDWKQVSGGSDGTASGGATLAQTGTFSFTAPTDEVDHWMYGSSGFWYQFRVSATLSNTVRLSGVQYTGDWQELTNMFNGVWVYPYAVSTTTSSGVISNYSGAAVDVSSLSAAAVVAAGFQYPVDALLLSPGSTPNSKSNISLDEVSYTYNDTSNSYAVGWNSFDTWSDRSTAFRQSGVLSFANRPTDWIKASVNGLIELAGYAVRLSYDSEMSANTVVDVRGKPYYDINDFGKSLACCAWKDRICYSFDRYSKYIYVTAKDTVNVLNGSDYGILEAGDGRSNRVVAMTQFYNEMVAFQEEKGPEGGCVTLFEGYSPVTFGKLLLSTKVGIMNSKSYAVVDGVLTSTATDEQLKKLLFWLSRYGVFVTDGRTVSAISDPIRNYFDPSYYECVRRGYEDEHWLEFDPTFNVLRIGLVSCPDATAPNVFLVYDLVDKVWYFDDLAQPLSCTASIEGAGDNPVIQIGGGVDDGYIYLLNEGYNDVETAIDSYIELVLNGEGDYLNLREVVLRAKAQAGGFATDIKLSVEANSLSKITEKTLTQEYGVRNQSIRRHRVPMNVNDQLVSLQVRNNDVDAEMYLHDAGFTASSWTRR